MELAKLLEDYRGGMSLFQIDHFVTGKGGPTQYARYMQCLRELHGRVKNLQQSYFELQLLSLEIEGGLEEIGIINNSFSMDDSTCGDCSPTIVSRKLGIEHKRKTIQLIESEKSYKALAKEFIRFYKQAVYLKTGLDELTPERVSEYETELWELKTKEMFCKDMLTNHGQISGGTIELLRSLPLKSRQKLFPLFSKQEGKDSGIVEKAIDWYLKQEDYMISNDFEKIEVPEGVYKVIDTDIKSLSMPE